MSPCRSGRNHATSAFPRHGMSSPTASQPHARAHARGPRLRPDELRPASFNKAPDCYFRDRQSTALTSAQLDENMRTGQGAKSAAAGKPSGPLSLRQSGWIRGERRRRGSLASRAENLQFRQRCSSERAKAFKGYGTLGCNSTGPTNREIAASPCGNPGIRHECRAATFSRTGDPAVQSPLLGRQVRGQARSCPIASLTTEAANKAAPLVFSNGRLSLRIENTVVAGRPWARLGCSVRAC